VQLPAADLDEHGRARLSYQQAEALFAKASGGATLHQLRHSALTHDAEQGTGTPMLMAYSGHTSVRSLGKYAKVSAEALARHQTERDAAPIDRTRQGCTQGARQRADRRNLPSAPGGCTGSSGGSGRFPIQHRRRKARLLSSELPNKAVPMIMTTTTTSITAKASPNTGWSTPMPNGVPSAAAAVATGRQGTRSRGDGAGEPAIRSSLCLDRLLLSGAIRGGQQVLKRCNMRRGRATRRTSSCYVTLITLHLGSPARPDVAQLQY